MSFRLFTLAEQVKRPILILSEEEEVDRRTRVGLTQYIWWTGEASDYNFERGREGDR